MPLTMVPLLDINLEPICDIFCQNETMLVPWSKISYQHSMKIYTFPFIMMAKFLKIAHSCAKLCTFEIHPLKYETEKSASKDRGFKVHVFLSNIPSEIIKITTSMSWILIWKVTMYFKYIKDHKFAKCSKWGGGNTPQLFAFTRLRNIYARAFQLKSTAGRIPVSQILRRATWSKIMGVLWIFQRILTIRPIILATTVD